MPKGSVYVGRGSKWGNPFVVRPDMDEGDVAEFGGFYGPYISVKSKEDAVIAFDRWLNFSEEGCYLANLAKTELRGRDLACWCKPDEPCHADVLLELANA